MTNKQTEKPVYVPLEKAVKVAFKDKEEINWEELKSKVKDDERNEQERNAKRTK